MAAHKTVAITLSTEEINVILEALGQQPYVKVFQLVDKITSTSYQQLNAGETAPEAQHENKPSLS